MTNTLGGLAPLVGAAVAGPACTPLVGRDVTPVPREASQQG